MGKAEYVREADRLAPGEALPAGVELDLRPLAGVWENTNPASRGIVRLEVTLRDGGLWLRTFGAAVGTATARDWGEAAAGPLFSDGLRSPRGHGFLARYDFGFMESHLQTNLSQGLLIVAAFNLFKDGSGRANYFSREFFHR
jgi:hypothetical protein